MMSLFMIMKFRRIVQGIMKIIRNLRVQALKIKADLKRLKSIWRINRNKRKVKERMEYLRAKKNKLKLKAQLEKLNKHVSKAVKSSSKISEKSYNGAIPSNIVRKKLRKRRTSSAHSDKNGEKSSKHLTGIKPVSSLKVFPTKNIDDQSLEEEKPYE